MNIATASLIPFALLAVAALPVGAADLSDPFGELAAIPGLQETGRPCPPTLPTRPLGLVDVVDIALCRNPQTASAWAGARSRAAAVGVARSAYLPTISASGSGSRVIGGQSSSSSGISVDPDGGIDIDPDDLNSSSSSSSSDTRYSASASLSYLLFDFGGRGAALDGARALLDAARSTRNATLQSVYLDAVTGYYAWVAADGSLIAAREAERAAQSSFDAASTREQIGTATRADRLQAQTALAQTQLARVQAEGALRNALGALATSMGLQANAPLQLAPAPTVAPAADFAEQLDPLVSAALEARPDLSAAVASLRAAETDVTSARASGLPSLSGSLSQSYSRTGERERDSASVGLSVSVPIFSGFATTYRVRAAEAQVEARTADLTSLRNQISQEVFQAHSELTTQTQSVFAAQALVAAAQESENVARGRYEAGVGTILDLINAQSSAADSRRQLILAQSNWAAARTRLAQAIGTLDTASDPSIPATSPTP
ncbi:MAG: TolC family protein [Panacagrimonas sp.]